MPMHYLLIYDLVDDYLTRRVSLRPAHFAYARPFVERGELLLGGALGDPVDRAVLLFRGETPEVARAFAEADPYVQRGLVTGWQVRPWTTVIGPDAAAPIAMQGQT